jgi:hypothetical protein
VGYEKTLHTSKGERKKAMHHLTFDRDDLRALKFIGNRYGIGSDLLGLISTATIVYDGKENDDPYQGFTATFDEFIAWQILDLLNKDTEDLTTSHPLLSSSSNLWNGLINLYNSVV